MKKKTLHTVILALTLPMSLYGLGLGKMKVKSALDQPFLAEIELLDIRSAPLSSIRTGLAAPETFQKLGIVPSDALSLLQFEIRKNEHGKYIIRIHSAERMSEPYMQLVVDLTSPKGQFYKAYTVLLDPPGYNLASGNVANKPSQYKRFMPGQRVKSTSASRHHGIELTGRMEHNAYGPTIAHENVWQIAQRYKVDQVILSQVVLAIVGHNPEAFNEGNLNGLKVGARLHIPSVNEMMKVPEDLATVEVMAHDKAWNEKTAINHVLTPPYTHAQSIDLTGVEYSEIPPVPRMSQKLEDAPEIGPHLIIPEKPISNEQDITLKSQVSVTSAAVDTLRESNAVLVEQLRIMQAQNKKLQGQLDKSNKDLKLLRRRIQVMNKERQAIASEVSTSTSKDSSSGLWLLLFLLAGASGAAFWYFKQQGKFNPLRKTPKSETSEKPVTVLPMITSPVEPAKTEPEVKDEPVVKIEPTVAIEPEVKDESAVKDEPEVELEPVIKDEPVVKVEPEVQHEPEDILEPDLQFEPEPQVQESESVIAEDVIDEKPVEPVEEQPIDNVLEFESGLHQVLTEKIEPKEIASAEAASNNESNLMDFTLETVNPPAEPIPAVEEPQKEDNSAAFDTLIDLAKTYLGMDDKESALNALNEVLEQGNETQKQAAQKIIDEIKKT